MSSVKDPFVYLAQREKVATFNEAAAAAANAEEPRNNCKTTHDVPRMNIDDERMNSFSPQSPLVKVSRTVTFFHKPQFVAASVYNSRDNTRSYSHREINTVSILRIALGIIVSRFTANFRVFLYRVFSR